MHRAGEAAPQRFLWRLTGRRVRDPSSREFCPLALSQEDICKHTALMRNRRAFGHGNINDGL